MKKTKYSILQEYTDMDDSISKAKEALASADAILIGASNGLSIAEGYNIFADNEMFRRQFGDFREKYGIHSVLDGVFARHMTSADHQQFIDTLVTLWYDEYKPSEVMADLRAIVEGTPCFVLTTNADEHLELAGFDPDDVWEMEGTFRRMQKGEQPSDKRAAFNDFLSAYRDKKLVVLELGIGSRNRIIKLPLMQIVNAAPQATYITLNLPHEIYVPGEIADKSIALPGDLTATLRNLANA